MYLEKSSNIVGTYTRDFRDIDAEPEVTIGTLPNNWLSGFSGRQRRQARPSGWEPAGHYGNVDEVGRSQLTTRRVG